MPEAANRAREAAREARGTGAPRSHTDWLHWAVDKAPVGVIRFDFTGRVLHANPAFAVQVDRPSSQAQEMNLLDAVPPDHRRAVEQQLSAAAEGTLGSLELELRVPTTGGTARHLVAEGLVLSDEDGRPHHALAHVRDLTGERGTLDALRRADDQLEAVAHGTALVVFSIDRQGRVLSWNPAAERMFGWRAADVIGRAVPIGEIADPWSDDHPLSGSEFDNREILGRRRDGTSFRGRVSLAPVLDEGRRRVATLAVMTDTGVRPAVERALREDEQRFRKLVQNISDTVTVIDVEGNILYTTGEVKEILGYPPEFWDERSAFDLAHPDDLAAAHGLLQRVIETPGLSLTAEFRAQHADGHWETIELTGVNLLDDPEVEGIVVTTRNVSERRQTERLLSDQRALLELIARGTRLDRILHDTVRLLREHSHDGHCALFLVDEGRLRLAASTGVPPEYTGAVDGRVLAEGDPANAAAVADADTAVIGDVADDDRARRHRDRLLAAGLHACWAHPIVESATGDVVGTFVTYYGNRHEPSAHELRAGEAAARLAGIAIDSDRAGARLAHQVLHDGLTGLPNRDLLVDRLEQALRRHARHPERVGLLFCDLDRFKVVNDSLGHAAGDRVLVAFAERLRAVVRPTDTVARFGGDEFVALIEGAGGLDEIRTIADRVQDALREPFVLDGGDAILTVSMGVALAAADEGAELLLRNADAAMYRAKERGRDRLEVFDDDLRHWMLDRLHFENDLRRALHEGELTLSYQPTVSLESGRVVGVEALLRWSHPQRGLVWPSEFVPVAEENGMIVPIGAWVLDEALRQAAEWLAAVPGHPHFLVAVNLSARQLGAPDLVPLIAAALDRHDWPPHYLVLELTESMLMEDADATLDVLRRLKALGVRLSIDDFGTGYSSLSYLDRFPVDIVKIDQSFVGSISSAGEGLAITTAVVRMARALGLVTVAEGVETKGQSSVLQSLGCDWAQGFHFSRPLPPSEAGALLDRAIP